MQLIRFNAFPGERVDLALRALAYKIAVGEIAPGLSASELLDIIEGMAVKQGGMEQCGDLSRTVGCFSSFSGGDALKSGMSGIDYLARLAPKHELIL